jgi:hypothetical protein
MANLDRSRARRARQRDLAQGRLLEDWRRPDLADWELRRRHRHALLGRRQSGPASGRQSLDRLDARARPEYRQDQMGIGVVARPLEIGGEQFGDAPRRLLVGLSVRVEADRGVLPSNGRRATGGFRPNHAFIGAPASPRDGRRARLQGSPRERPESSAKPPFYRGARNRLHRPFATLPDG